MNRLAVLIAFALCLPLTAHADDASLHAKAQELVTLLHTDRMVSQVSDNLRKRYSDGAQRVVGPNPTPEAKAKLADFDKKISGLIDAQVDWKLMEPSFTNAYAKTFSEDELSGIIAFYKSPAGMAFLEKTPSLNSQITQFTQSKMAALQSQLNQAMDEFRKSQIAAPATAPAPAASTPK